MEIHIHARTENSFKGLVKHYGESKKMRNMFKLKALGVSQSLDANKKLLVINFKGLIKKIMRKGGDFRGYKEQLKADLLTDIKKTMDSVDAEPNSYEVVFNDTTN